MNQQKHKILVIGAGPSGLSLLRAFEAEKQLWNDCLEIVCVEKQSEWGGQWNFIAKDKLDKYGMPIPSTNEYLWTNAPKECFEYPDYSFDTHFNGTPMPSYLPRQYLRDYFIKRFSYSPICNYIKFDTIANNIHYKEETKKFTVEIESLKTKHKTLSEFDYVVVASGHYSQPNVPKINGLTEFKGKLLHSVQVTDYLDYKNERVLVIGSGLSAEDAVLQCYKYGAKSITVTYRTKPMSQKFPESIEQLPLLTKVQGKTVTFRNGQQRQFDTIIMCTGYVHNFTFLSQELRLQNCSKLWSDDLYMGVVFVNNPKLMYLGMQAQYFSFMMFDIQSHFVRNAILQKSTLPLIQEMKEDNVKRAKKQCEIKTSYDVISFMGEYLSDLMKLAKYEGYELGKVIKLYFQLQRHKEENILTFRDNVYQSTVSGKWSIMKTETWLEAGASFQNGGLDPQMTESIIKTEQKLKELGISDEICQEMNLYVTGS